MSAKSSSAVPATSRAQEIFTPLHEEFTNNHKRLEGQCLEVEKAKGLLNLRYSQIHGKLVAMPDAEAFQKELAVYVEQHAGFKKAQEELNQLSVRLAAGIKALSLEEYSVAALNRLEITLPNKQYAEVLRYDQIAKDCLRQLIQDSKYIESLRAQMNDRLPKAESSLAYFKGLASSWSVMDPLYSLASYLKPGAAVSASTVVESKEPDDKDKRKPVTAATSAATTTVV